MASKMAALCQLTMAMARCQDVRTICESLSDRADVESWEVEESILQSIPYSGIPAAVEALGDWRTASGVSASESDCSTENPAVDLKSVGANVFEVVYGDNSERVRSELVRRHPTLEAWIIEFAYGRVMGRSILSQREVEALGVASLLAQARHAPLHSHVRGARRCGWSATDLRELLAELEIDDATRAFAEQLLSDEQSDE